MGIKIVAMQLEDKYICTLIDFQTEKLKNTNDTPYRWCTIEIDGFSGQWTGKLQGKNLPGKIGKKYYAFPSVFTSESGRELVNFNMVTMGKAPMLSDFLAAAKKPVIEQVEEV